MNRALPSLNRGPIEGYWKLVLQSLQTWKSWKHLGGQNLKSKHRGGHAQVSVTTGENMKKIAEMGQKTKIQTQKKI